MRRPDANPLSKVQQCIDRTVGQKLHRRRHRVTATVFPAGPLIKTVMPGEGLTSDLRFFQGLVGATLGNGLVRATVRNQRLPAAPEYSAY